MSKQREELSVSVNEWRQRLNETPKVYAWLAQRGLYHSAVEKFTLGFDGERLTIPYFDYFRGVQDVSKRALGESKFKYLRTGNYPFFVRAADHDRVVLCEGEIDTITAHMAGFKAMGIAGSEAWEDYWGYLLRDCEVTIAFDGDDAGRMATARVYKTLKAMGIAVSYVELPEGEDINSLWCKGGKDLLWRSLTSGKGGRRAR